MSLIASASPWVNDDPTVAQRKRIATMKTPASLPPPLPNAQSATAQSTAHSSDIRTYSTNNDDEVDRPSRISELVDKIASTDPPSRLALHTDNTGNGLADFKPRDSSHEIQVGIQIDPPSVRKSDPSTPFAPNPNHTAKLSNYRQSYETPMMRGGMPNGVSNLTPNVGDVKVADRLSYIIHLLEEMKNEKTNNVTEEFVLYSLLGIFVIYIVDAFARTGKYTR